MCRQGKQHRARDPEEDPGYATTHKPSSFRTSDWTVLYTRRVHVRNEGWQIVEKLLLGVRRNQDDAAAERAVPDPQVQ
jgi:hypothetical protein